MTILIQVIKENLISALNEQIDSLNSKAKPKEEASWRSSFFPVSYNKDLAKSKCLILRGLRKFINTMDEKETDIATIKSLCNSIRAYKQKIELESQKYNFSPGTTEATLDRLVRFSDIFYQKARELRLLDLDNANGAFAHFTKAVSLYHARRIMDDCHPSVLKGFIDNPYITSINAFHQAVDTSVNENFLLACRNIDGQKQYEQENYLVIKNELGSLCIEFLIFKYERLKKDYSLGSFMMLPDYLNDYLVSAKTAIIEDQTTENTSLFTDEDLGNYDTILDLNLDKNHIEEDVIEEENQKSFDFE